MWGYQEEEAIIILASYKHFVYTAWNSARTQPLKRALYDAIFISSIAQNLESSAIECSCKRQEGKRRSGKG